MKFNLRFVKQNSKAFIAIGLLLLTVLAYFLVDSRFFQGYNKLQKNNLAQCIETDVDLHNPDAFQTNSIYNFKVRENCSDVKFEVMKSAGELYFLNLNAEQTNPNEVEFSVSNNLEDAIVVWDFDDGNTAIDQTKINHTFELAGEYLVAVRATKKTNSGEITLTTEKLITIDNDKQFEVPTENFEKSELDFAKEITPKFDVSLKESTEKQMTYTFTDMSAPSENVMSWNWDFGDNSEVLSFQKDSKEAETAQTFGIEHSYNLDFEENSKDFVVKLTVTNENGEKFETSEIVNVAKPESNVEEIKEDVKSAFHNSFFASVISADSDEVQEIEAEPGSAVLLATGNSPLNEAVSISANGENVVYNSISSQIESVNNVVTPIDRLGENNQQDQDLEAEDQSNEIVSNSGLICTEEQLSVEAEYLNLLLQTVLEDGDVLALLPPEVEAQFRSEMNEVLTNLENLQTLTGVLEELYVTLEEVLSEDGEVINQFLNQLYADFGIEVDLNQLLPILQRMGGGYLQVFRSLSQLNSVLDNPEIFNQYLKDFLFYKFKEQISPELTDEQFRALLVEYNFEYFTENNEEIFAQLFVTDQGEYPISVYEYADCKYFPKGILLSQGYYNAEFVENLLSNFESVENDLNDLIGYLNNYQANRQVCELVGNLGSKTQDEDLNLFNAALLPNFHYQKFVVEGDELEIPHPNTLEPGVINTLRLVEPENTLVELNQTLNYLKDQKLTGEDFGFFALEFEENAEYSSGALQSNLHGYQNSRNLPGFALYCFELPSAIERVPPKDDPKPTSEPEPTPEPEPKKPTPKEEKKPEPEPEKPIPLVPDVKKPVDEKKPETPEETKEVPEEKPKPDDPKPDSDSKPTSDPEPEKEETKVESEAETSNEPDVTPKIPRRPSTTSPSGSRNSNSEPVATSAPEVEEVDITSEHTVEEIIAANPCLKPADEDKIRTFSDLEEDYYAYDVVKLLSEITEDVDPIVIGRKGPNGIDNFEGESYLFRGEGVKIIAKPGCFASIAGEKDLWDPSNKKTFQDLNKNYWGYENMNGFLNLNILEGYKSDNTIRPKGFMTIAEYNKLLVEAIMIREYIQDKDDLDFEDFEDKKALVDEVYGDVLDSYDENPFPDVEEDDWFYDYAILAHHLKITEGIEGRFRGNQNITRAQAAIMTYNYFVANIKDEIIRR